MSPDSEKLGWLVPLDARADSLFGFSEFLAALALMVLAWTIADVRYRFRVRTTPIPLQATTFFVIGAVGILTLLTDLWRAEHWPVPRGKLITPSMWQALLGAAFLWTFLTWAWYAFIRPPVYGRRNCGRYGKTLYRAILKGSPSELSVVADELKYSAAALIRHATNGSHPRDHLTSRKEHPNREATPPRATAYADDILLLIAEKRFCRTVVASSPGTALALFQEIGATKKFGVQINIFAKNIVNEALANRDSFLFHESEGSESGLIGFHKPLSQAMFANYRMVESIGTLLDADFRAVRKWEAWQWEAYCRIVLITLRNYVDEEFWNHSFVLHRATMYIMHAVSDLYKLDGVSTTSWEDDPFSKLRVVVEFVKESVQALDQQGVEYVHLRTRGKAVLTTFYDRLAEVVVEIICSASKVQAPQDLCWLVQHNFLWGELFNFNNLTGRAASVMKFKVRRLIYDDIKVMREFPNFKGATILGFCLNVMGFSTGKKFARDTEALHKAVLAWTRKNYDWLYQQAPDVAEACLVDGITYDSKHRRLVKRFPTGGLRRKARIAYFEVESASS
jgi:hypothetical protein